jgi:tetratricopeptide (TPR) repeat protein
MTVCIIQLSQPPGKGVVDVATDTELLKQAQEAIREKDYDEAIAILRQIPDNPTAQEWLAKLTAATEAKDQLVEAQALIKAQRYDEARVLLEEMGDNPKAQEWLAQLDRLAPEETGAPTPPRTAATPTPAPAAGRTRAPDVSPLRPDPEPESQFNRERLQAQMGDVSKQAQEALVGMGVDLNVGLLVVILAAVSAILAALLDAILGLPGGLLDFAFGWIVVALNAPTYAIIKKQAKLDGLLVAGFIGLFTALIWYIVASIITGDPDYQSDGATRWLFKFWLDDLGIIDALITGIVIGLVSFGWVFLLYFLPDKVRAYLPKV